MTTIKTIKQPTLDDLYIGACIYSNGVPFWVISIYFGSLLLNGNPTIGREQPHPPALVEEREVLDFLDGIVFKPELDRKK